jgi:hypothetical protein
MCGARVMHSSHHVKFFSQDHVNKIAPEDSRAGGSELKKKLRFLTNANLIRCIRKAYKFE